MTRLKYKGILFDLDGTLLDTTPLILETFQYTFLNHYNRKLSLEDIQPYMGQPLIAAMQALGPGDEEMLIQTYREYNLAKHDALVGIFDGVYETVCRLHAAGAVLAVVTSKTAGTARRGLRLFNMEPFFTEVVGLEDTDRHKPLPEPVLCALDRIRLSPNECLMVGDSPHDIESAKAAGVATAGVGWSRVNMDELVCSNPDYMLKSMTDLLTIFTWTEGMDK
jgi:pyrophosphatase PpaX